MKKIIAKMIFLGVIISLYPYETEVAHADNSSVQLTGMWDATSTELFGGYALTSNAETDQSSNLQYIIDEAARNNKSIYIPSGSYILNSNVKLRSGTHIVGDNKNATILKNTTGKEVVLEDENYSESQNIKIEHLFFDGVGIFTRLAHTISIHHNIFYHPVSLFPINLHASKGAVMEGNIFMRDKNHTTPDTENRAIFIGGFATSGLYQYIEDVTIENNLFGIKLDELDAIKSFSNESIIKTINQLQHALETDQLKIEENEQNFLSTGVNSYNNAKNVLIKDNFFYQMYENDDRYGVVGDHAIYLRGSQDVQVVGNHVRGLHNGPYGGFKFKSGRNITIMNNYLRNTGIVMYETPEFGLGDNFSEGTVAELSGWLVANNIFDFKAWQDRYAIGIEYNRHTGIDNVYNGVFMDNHFVNYHNIPQNRRRELLIQNADGEGFKGESTVVLGNTRDDREANQLDVEYWSDKDYQMMPKDWKSLVDSNLYERYKNHPTPIRNTLPISKNSTIKLGEAVNPYDLVDQINDADEEKPMITILNPEVLEQIGEHKVFLKLVYQDTTQVNLTAIVTVEGKEKARIDETTGQITFLASDQNESIVIPPEGGPGNPDVDIEPGNPGVVGPLAVVKAPTMNFGTQVISNHDKTYNMLAEMQNLNIPHEDGTTEVPYVSFAQVVDTRGTNAGWNLKVSLTNFTSTSHNNSLKGVRIYLRNPRIEYVSNNLNDAPLSHIDKLALEPGTGGVSLMSATQNKGAGTSSIVWGNQKELNEQFENSAIELVENDAIQLFVPRETTADVGTYRSTLSWELSDIPGPDA